MRQFNAILYFSCGVAACIWLIAEYAGSLALPHMGASKIPLSVAVLHVLYFICFFVSILYSIRTVRQLIPLWGKQRFRSYDPKDVATSSSIALMTVAYEDGFMSALTGARFQLPLIICSALVLLARIEFIVPPRVRHEARS